jgi:hypothetical protein
MEAEIEKIIRAYFDEEAGVKLSEEPDGSLFDRDSNWGFSPTELARLIAEAMKGRG